MHLGLGLYRHMITPQNLAFARQCGATHVVLHLVDYFNQDGRSADHESADQPVSAPGKYWGISGDPERIWDLQDLLRLREQIEAAGLKWHAIENFDPSHWYDILLDGPRREEQIDNVKDMIQSVGAAGIPILGYNFSLAGVYGRVVGPYARGGALSVGMEGVVDTAPIPDGIVWNMRLPGELGTDSGKRARCSTEELWSRLDRFLDDVLPVAEEAGVRLALHPDDPPVARIRDTPRLVIRPEHYQRVIDAHPSPANALEFCIGTLAEMPDCDIYEATRQFASQNRLGYVHLRNVQGEVPNYREVFVDEGKVDMRRVIRILRQCNYQGILIPDHTPQVCCDAPWHAGMAYAMGYMRALITEHAD